MDTLMQRRPTHAERKHGSDHYNADAGQARSADTRTAGRVSTRFKNRRETSMLRAGSIILSIWIVLNLFPSLAIVVNTTFLGGKAPGLYAILGEDEIEALSHDVVSTANSIAIWANGLNVAFCLLAFASIWMGLNRGVIWVFWGLAVAFVAALMAGIAADHAVGTAFPEINIISALIVTSGLICAAIGMFRKRPGPALEA